MAISLATATGAVDLSLVDVLLVLAPLVIVPVGVVAAGRRAGGRALPWLRLAAAVLVVPALLAGRGGLAGALVVPWLAVAVAMALVSVFDWLRVRTFSPAALASLASPLFLTVGATWLVMSRLGLRPVGIGEPIVELTAVHFHYAGFAAALLAARTAEATAHRAPRWATVGPLLTIAAPPMVALGFTTGSPTFQVGGALLLSVGVWIVAGLTLTIVVPATRWPAKGLLGFSAVAVVVPMALAVFWAAAQHVDVPALDIPAMARVHGALNAVGFSMAGLLGWVARDADTGNAAPAGSSRPR